MTRAQQVKLWEAINRYVVACGGDPAAHIHGNVSRMNAVVDVEKVIGEIERGAVTSCLDEALNSGNGSYKP